MLLTSTGRIRVGSLGAGQVLAGPPASRDDLLQLQRADLMVRAFRHLPATVLHQHAPHQSCTTPLQHPHSICALSHNQAIRQDSRARSMQATKFILRSSLSVINLMSSNNKHKPGRLGMAPYHRILCEASRPVPGVQAVGHLMLALACTGSGRAPSMDVVAAQYSGDFARIVSFLLQAAEGAHRPSVQSLSGQPLYIIRGQ